MSLLHLKHSSGGGGGAGPRPPPPLESPLVYRSSQYVNIVHINISLQYTYAKTDETGEIIGRGCQIGPCVNQKEVSGNEIAEIVCCGNDKCNGKGAAPALAISYVLLMVALVIMKM